MKGCCLWIFLCLLVPACFVQVKSQYRVANTCNQNEVQCDIFECIPKESWCDGEFDCSDQSDEEYCKTKYWYQSASSANNCNEKHFVCGTGPCVPVATKCDGFENCRDGSDEKDCDKTEIEILDSEEITSKIPTIKIRSDVFDDEFFDSDESIETPEITETISSTSYATPVTSVSPTSPENYYHRRYTENTNDHISIRSNFDYNRAQNVHLLYKHNQDSSHSSSSGKSRIGQIPHHSTGDEIGGNSQINGHSSSEPTYTRSANSQYGSEVHIRSGYPNGTFVRLPPRKFPRIVQPSVSDTHYTDSQHGREGHIRYGYPNGTFVRLPPREFPSIVQPSVLHAGYTNSQRGSEGHIGSGYPNGTFVPSVSPRTVQPSISDTRYTNSQHGSEGNVRLGNHNEVFATVQPPISKTHYANNQHDNEENVRLVHLNGVFVKLPPRAFPRKVQPSISVTHYTNSQRTQLPRTTSTYSANYPAAPLSHDQLSDYGNYEDGVQSDDSQPENLRQFFIFKNNYTQKFAYAYKENVERAEQWILAQRNTTYGWGENTPRALIALSLITNSFSFKYIENELMKKSLAVHFGIKMLQMRDNPKVLTNSTLATYVNALLATCQDPKRFFDNDLTNELRIRTTYFGTDVNPLACLTLCLTNTDVAGNELQQLISLLEMKDSDERSSDMQILATTALACFQRQDRYKAYLKDIVKRASENLLRRRLPNYSFGSVYSTALAAQALMSIDGFEWRDAKKTMDFLIKHQLDDGSFGDMLATYYVLPALSGRSLLHLRNTECDPVPETPVPPPTDEFGNETEPKIGIYYTIKVGYPEISSVSTYLEIPIGYNFLYAMKKAQKFNSQFRFLYREFQGGKTDVHTIIDIPNDTERGFRWKLYESFPTREGNYLNLEAPSSKDVAELIPEDHQELVYWYLPMSLTTSF